MFLYGITLVPLVKELRTVVMDLLAPFYIDNTTSNGTTDRSTRLMTILLDPEVASVYLPEPYKSLLICDLPSQE